MLRDESEIFMTFFGRWDGWIEAEISEMRAREPELLMILTLVACVCLPFPK